MFADEASGQEMTTGTPIALLIENVDQRSKDYSEIKDKYRPGHAGYTYDVKYGFHDYRGGGRASARETAARVAAGAIARKVVPGRRWCAARWCRSVRMPSTARAGTGTRSRAIRSSAPMRKTAELWAEYLDGVRKAGSSAGAVIEVVAENVPAGLGAPVYGKLDADLAAALMGINAVKGVEIGDGFAAADSVGRGQCRRDADGQ